MPVRKFRSIGEMSQPRWLSPGDPAIVAAMTHLWTIARVAGVRRRFPAGVHKHASIDDMQRVQAAWASDSPEEKR